ncbi:MAG: Gmad2 immunoglobulin-like domain-containing protein [Thermoanaerobacterales bacterium]|nr:Gmad2 immunoglobulin-like domain-containing protein [Bacillota bacterium]MDI6906189.1 Gmad2 immunoglobulin-like domain-containing protein [Thermoanaerobacterales bacterium]
MKRLLVLAVGLLVALSAVAVAGCGGDKKKPSAPPGDVDQPATMPVAVYYLKTTDKDMYLVREVHEVARTEDTIRAALEELIHGNPVTEGAARVLPPETRVRGVKVDNGLATVDFSREVLQANVGAVGEALGIQSVVNTLTEFPDIKRVAFQVEGGLDERAMDWWGHVGLHEQPFTRNLSTVWEPAIWVTSPRPGDKVESPLKVQGSARVFEGAVSLRLTGDDGQKLAETCTTAAAGAPERGDFTAELTFSAPMGGQGRLEVFWNSPRDGSELDKVQIPVKF